MSKQYSMKVYPAGRGRDVYRNIEICGNESLDRLCEISWKPLILLMNICMSSAWTTVCIVKMRISQIQREMNRQRISLLIRSDFIKGRNFRFTMTLEMIGCSPLQYAKISEAEESFEPRIVKSKGDIQQYPDLDEEDCDYE